MLGGMITPAPEKQDGDDNMNQSSQDMQILLKRDDQADLLGKTRRTADVGTYDSSRRLMDFSADDGPRSSAIARAKTR